MNKIQATKKLNILCLHGYFQDAAMMKERTPAIYRKLKSIANLYYLDGPIKVNSMEGYKPELGDEKIGKAWWTKDENNSYPQFESTVDYILDCYKTNGPFDGILGFSQGAGLALFLTALQEKGDIATDFKFVISYSGFYPTDRVLQKLMDDRLISIPSLHFIGKEDDKVDPKSSEHVAKCFMDPHVVYHAGGHYIPQNGEIKETIYQFLLPFVDVHCHFCLKKDLLRKGIEPLTLAT